MHDIIDCQFHKLELKSFLRIAFVFIPLQESFYDKRTILTSGSSKRDIII